MTYRVVFERRAEKELKKLPANIYQSIVVAIEAIAENPRLFGYRK